MEGEDGKKEGPEEPPATGDQPEGDKAADD